MMNRRYILALILSFLLITVKGIAYDFKVDGLCYNKLSDNTVELTWEDVGKPYKGDIIVPRSVSYSGNEYEVVAIGESAMVYVQSSNGSETLHSINPMLKTVSIPSSVTSIGLCAFGHCTGLTSITIPSSVTSIGQNAFYGCCGLTSIIVESGNTKYDSRDGCNAIIETKSNVLLTGCKKTTIPNSVTSVGQYAFYYFHDLTFISIPNSVTSIGDHAFYSCSGLTSITIPSSVTSIGDNAFDGCSGLTSVISEIKDPFVINEYVFSSDTYSTTTLTVPAGTKSKYQNTNGWKNFKNIVEAEGNDSETPKLVAEIDWTQESAYYEGVWYSSYCKVTVHKGEGLMIEVTPPSGYASYWEAQVPMIAHLPDLNEGGNYQVTFTLDAPASGTICLDLLSWDGSGASMDQMINVQAGLYEYTVAFENYPTACTNAMLFYQCGKMPGRHVIKKVQLWDMNGGSQTGDISSTKRTIHVATAGTLPKYISESEKYNIEELTLTGELNGTDFRLLRDMAGCNYQGVETEGKLTVLDISGARIVAGGERYIDTDFFLGVSVRNYYFSIEESDEMPQHIFHGCKLVSLVLPTTINNIGYAAFSGCSGLISITIPNSVISIGSDAFRDCSSLTSIILPNSIKGIRYSTFQDCKGLTSIKLPNSVIVIQALAFSGCSGLTSITIPNSVTNIGDNAFFGCSGLTSITIPNSVTNIGEYAFYGCSGLTSITIPNSLTFISRDVFYDCSSLASITIPNSVTNIGSGAFYGCSALTSITIPNSVTTIGKAAFADCGRLASITIPNSVTNIESGAFNCRSLEDVISEIKNPFEIAEDVFSVYSTATLTVPRGTKSAYQSTNYWNKFSSIVESGANNEWLDELLGMEKSCNDMMDEIDNTYSELTGGRDFVPEHKSILDYTFSLMKEDVKGLLYRIGQLMNNVNGLTEEMMNEVKKDFDIIKGRIGVDNYNSPLYTFRYYIQRGTFTCNEGGSIIVGSISVRNETRTLWSFYSKAFFHCYDSKSDFFRITIVPDDGYHIASLKVGNSQSTETSFESDYADNAFVAEFEHASGSLLPAGYTEVEYIQNDSYGINNEAPYINTNYYPNNTTRVKCDFQYTVGGTHRRLLGAGKWNQVNTYCIEAENTMSQSIPADLYLRYGYGTEWNKTGKKIDMNRHQIDFNRSLFYMDGELQYTCNNYTFTASYPMALFGFMTNTFCDGSKEWMNGRIYSCQIYDNDVLVRDFVPAKRNSDSKVGLYDLVNDVFYTSPNNKNFTSGPEIINTSTKRTIHVTTAGTLKNMLGINEALGVTDLTLTGHIDARDFSYIKMYCVNVENIDLTNVIIDRYSGNEGTMESQQADYPANEIPAGAFFYWNNTIEYPNSKKDAGMPSIKKVKLPQNITAIRRNAFARANNLEEIDIPEGVLTVDYVSFALCSSLKKVILPSTLENIGQLAFNGCSFSTITIPANVNKIDASAFDNCSNLSSVISKIQNPFSIQENVFTYNTYSNATLTVPAGTKSVYQSTNYWNMFKNIVETGTEQGSFTINGITYAPTSNSLRMEVTSIEDGKQYVDIPSSVTNNGSTYQVTSVSNEALSNRTFNYVSFPSTITSLNSSTLSGSTLGALIWNANAFLSQSVFNNVMFDTSSNFLLYVNSSSYAPSNVKNVVVGDVAQTIVLSDNGSIFYCPIEFTARSISYSHHYSMETGGNGKGWETIALPFDVQRIEHKSKGVLTPFASYYDENTQRPFWLYEFGSSGFKRTDAIKANTPYIIAMPNSSNYDDYYNVAGEVTFSATNAKVPVSSSTVTATSGDRYFVPAFAVKDQSSTIYVLNVSNDRVSYSGSYDKGSRFIPNLRPVYPFEAYMTTLSSSYAKPFIEIEFEDGTTGIDVIPMTGNKEGSVKVYSLNGQLIIDTDKYDLEEKLKHLPSGIYIVNGKKVVVK